MDTERQSLDQQIVARYSDQPARLPAELRLRIEDPVQLYAYADLDDALRLAGAWVVLGPDHVTVARQHDGAWALDRVRRAEIRSVHETPGLSATTLTLTGAVDAGPALAVFRYTHRQRRAFENLRFVLEEALEGRELPATDADREYAEAVARPV